ncbi:MAG: hypothetical protein NTY14_03800 [Candidatus Omnitrophica bacterium]|nr:hypothetical protein [Candidatus Omnitrophota bacterium]
MIRAILRNTVIISSLGHLLVLGMFSFSFNSSKPGNLEPALIFWGQILPKAALDFRGFGSDVRQAINPKLDTVLPKRLSPESSLSMKYSLKPGVELPFNTEKPAFTPPDVIPEFVPQKRDSPIMFHPMLPYQLQLYFKDRQAVHIELMFNIVSLREKNSILIKRKISSGNLEADLLSSRYINHYLFIQQARFSRDNWQTVKIDLSSKND